MKFLLIVKSIFLFSFFAFGQTPSSGGMTLRWSDRLPKALELDASVAPHRLSLMSRSKWYENQNRWKECVRTSGKVVTRTSLDYWVANLHLKCLRRYSETGKAPFAELVQHFSKISNKKKDLLESPFPDHGNRLINTYLYLGEKGLKEKDSSKAQSFLDLYKDLLSSMEEADKARYYEIQGRLALKSNNKKMALSHLLEGFSLNPRKKTIALLKDLGHQVVKYLKRFPDAPRAPTVGKNILSSLRRLVYKRQKSFDGAKKSVLSELGNAPGVFILPWARSIYGRGYFSEAFDLASAASSQFKKNEEGKSEALLIAGRSAYYSKQFSKARSYFLKLMDQHKESEHAAEGTYYLGLLYFREQNHRSLIALNEKFLQSELSEKYELQVRYWLYRSLEKEKSPKAKGQLAQILKKFPLTYYGLRLRFESSNNLQSLFQKGIDPKMQITVPWDSEQVARWSRIKLLLSSGWTRAAGREIDLLPDPRSGKEFLLRAKVWVAARNSVRTMQVLAKAIDSDSALLTKEVLEMAFPYEHLDPISKYGDIHGLDTHLILALIRQESGFIKNAVSPSKAMGLMQLIPGTAKETAKWIRLKNFRIPASLFDPTTNIRMGTHYLRRMVKKYKGVVPLALAAYNVGPGNMDRWLRQRTDLKDWATWGKEDVHDLWMDEVPWAETSFYAKAVLRNYLLYKIIYNKEQALPLPPWQEAQTFVER